MEYLFRHKRNDSQCLPRNIARDGVVSSAVKTGTSDCTHRPHERHIHMSIKSERKSPVLQGNWDCLLEDSFIYF